jgi:3-hydroxyacyl-[acyl-carrier-protein] dehydratase
MKFLAAVRPEEEIFFRAQKLGQVGALWQFQTQARIGEKVVAEGQLVLNLTPEGASVGLE